MNLRNTLVRAGAVLASAAAIVSVAAPANAAPRGNARNGSVQVTVVDVTPSTPKPTQKLVPLTVTLQLHNTGATPYNGISVVGERGAPITKQEELDASLANPSAPSTAGLQVDPIRPVTVDLAATEIKTVQFITTTRVPTEAGLCLCAKGAVYPLFFSAHLTIDGVDTVLGDAATYVPAFYQKPPPMYVSWVWPLLERPHRLTADNVFTDDLLAGLVAPGGRLARALDVVSQLPPGQPLTLLLDPELLDELWVMAHQPYTVPGANGKPLAGSGKAVATAWLDELNTVLVNQPDVQVQLTPYADPDVQAVTSHKMTWDATMPTAMTAHVTQILAGRSLDSSVAWPVEGAIGKRTLATLAGDGVNTVLLDSTAVRPQPPAGSVPSGYARVRSGGRDMAAPLLSADVEKAVSKAITLGSAGSGGLQQLVAELAVRVAIAVNNETPAEQGITITAPRYVDPDVTAAVRAITDTSSSTFARPLSLQTAVSGTPLPLPTTASTLAPIPANATRHVPLTIDAAAETSADLPGISSLLDHTDAGARSFLNGLHETVQRAQSSAWRSAPAEASDYANRLTSTVDSVRTGVRIVPPTPGLYTLASSSSPLPVTIDNHLQYPVIVRVNVMTRQGEPGLTAKDIGPQHIDSQQKRTLHIPTTTDRPGRIQIVAELLTPNPQHPMLLSSVDLTVRSTALGFIGVVITIVAGAVLLTALLWRFARRMRQRRRRPPLAATPIPVTEPEPIA
ncbi:MAG TPA: DUF6049 family protein [Jatrophihabitans sp.]|nr:DUF6049 family protein [Jatrophihabitans sp.]